METLRNALGFFEENGQIVVKKAKSGRQEAVMTLHPDWLPMYTSNRSRLTIDVFRMVQSRRKVSYGTSLKGSQFRVVREKTGKFFNCLVY